MQEKGRISKENTSTDTKWFEYCITHARKGIYNILMLYIYIYYERTHSALSLGADIKIIFR